MTVAGSTVTDKEMEADIRSNLDLILGATSGLSGGLTQITQLFSDKNVVTTSPANLDLNALLSGTPITITANFGSGYRTAAGSILTGRGQIKLSNISFGSQGIGGDLLATFSNITKDGVPFLNGGLSGSVKLTQKTEDSGDISGYVTFNGLKI
ncbi:MAG: hypothetical protein P8Y00_12820, partial [Deltaproteobacteria bacterium]